LGGMTGTGKTTILAGLAAHGEQILDLEALASHRGSSYGSLGLPPQPSNEQFENLIALQWASFDPQRSVWIEAESKRIGICRIPEALFQQMEQAPVLEIERSRSERLAILLDVYGATEVGKLIEATERIYKRLGGLRTQQAVELLRQGKLIDAFDIILDYYDKTYTYDLKRRTVPIHPLNVSSLSTDQIATLLIEIRQNLAVNSSLKYDALLTS
jgi:tRNA 2-selenouridine synthase